MTKCGRDPFSLISFLICGNLIFYSANWTEYFTHILRTNTNNVGVTEIHMVMIFVNLLCGWYSDEFFQQSFLGVKLSVWLLGIVFISMFLTLPPLFKEAWQKCENKNKFMKMLVPIISYLFSIMYGYVFAYQFFEVPTLSIVLAYNITFNIIAIKIITASLTNMDYSSIQPEIVSLYICLTVLGMGSHNSGDFSIILTVYNVFSIGRLIQMSTSIILDISKYLKINIFIVPNK